VKLLEKLKKWKDEQNSKYTAPFTVFREGEK